MAYDYINKRLLTHFNIYYTPTPESAKLDFDAQIFSLPDISDFVIVCDGCVCVLCTKQISAAQTVCGRESNGG